MHPPDWLSIPAAGPKQLTGKGRGCALICVAAARLAGPCKDDPAAIIPAGLGPLERLELVEPGELDPFASQAYQPVDRHRLDVALSRGRHAAERARLAGCRLLFCLGIGIAELEQGLVAEAAMGPHQAAYARLRHLPCFEIAALTGALIAGAQMGMWLYPIGERALLASQIASAINPGLRLWLKWGCQDPADLIQSRPFLHLELPLVSYSNNHQQPVPATGIPSVR